MKKKLTALALVVVMVAMLFTGLTMAYFTDNETVTNTFTVGDVEIDLIEPNWKPENDNGEKDDVMENIVPGISYPKDPQVINTGKNDAYVRITVTIPGTADMSKLLLGLNTTDWALAKSEIKDGNWVAIYNYKNILAKGATTPALFTDFGIPADMSEEDFADLVVATNGEFTVNVFAEAIQTEGFDSAEYAYSELSGKVIEAAADDDALIAALEAGNNVILTADVDIDPATMSNAYGTTGINVKNGQTIDGNGNTLDIQGAGGTWDSGINTTGGLIKDLTVTGSFRGIFINHNSTHSERVVLENVTIDGTTYTISCDQGLNQGLTATDSTFNGWTSYAGTLGDAKFVNCEFGEGNGYAYMRPYAPTEFIGCDFKDDYTVDPRAAVTFENCTIDGVALTDANLADLVTDIAKVTVK